VPSVEYLSLRDAGGCRKCGAKENLTRDHLWPKSKGGCSCEGNFQLLCAKCNRWKGSEHDGYAGHQKQNCPETKLQRFMEKWGQVRLSDQVSDIEAMLPEIMDIREELAEFRCSPSKIQQAHAMVGSVKAEVRDFYTLLEARNRKKLPGRRLDNLRKAETSLVVKLAEVRGEIEAIESQAYADPSPDEEPGRSPRVIPT
jgi:hypothetical protein